eukprot:446160-Prorocentrum_minimum.AAC.3
MSAYRSSLGPSIYDGMVSSRLLTARTPCPHPHSGGGSGGLGGPCAGGAGGLCRGGAAEGAGAEQGA